MPPCILSSHHCCHHHHLYYLDHQTRQTKSCWPPMFTSQLFISVWQPQPTHSLILFWNTLLHPNVLYMTFNNTPTTFFLFSGWVIYLFSVFLLFSPSPFGFSTFFAFPSSEFRYTFHIHSTSLLLLSIFNSHHIILHLWNEAGTMLCYLLFLLLWFIFPLRGYNLQLKS